MSTIETALGAEPAPSIPSDPELAIAKPMLNTPSAQFGYIFSLDALRLFAVTIVIVRHYEIIKSLPGGFGVSVFFFISGFLITRLLLAEEKRFGKIGLGAFYTRRFIRLLPPLMLMGIVAVPVLYLLDPADFSWPQIAYSFFYLGNIERMWVDIFGLPRGYSAIEPLWSLAVEEHFYLLLPPALLLLRSMRARIWLMVGAILLPLFLRLWIFGIFSPDMADHINYPFTFTRLDSMAWGVLLTLLLESGKLRIPQIDRFAHLLVWGGGVLMIASMVHYTPMYEDAIKYTPQSLAIGIFFVGVVFATSYDWLRRVMEWKPIVHLGRISYEMYLWHFPILTIILAFVPSRVHAIPLALVMTVVVSDLAYRLTTKRLRGLRKRFGAHPVS